ncbi:MAG: alpha/beta fold hydrolase [Gammaproteobacteria bacterium]|nr:alpha/beta fold hydrolase [Gammaproteobacteria bacterium]
MPNDFYTEKNHGPYQILELGDFELQRGGTLPNCKLAYTTAGELNAEKSNAILFPVMFSGTSGSLQHYIGAGLALDPTKYFIIVPNQLGNGLSSSPNNTDAPFNGASFPPLDIADDVRAQHRLITEHFGISELQLVVGWSMGAQQTYEWAVRYPNMVRRAAPIAGTARTTPHDTLYVDTFCEALKSDPVWNNGDYGDDIVKDGLQRLAHVFALMGVCPEFYKQQLWQRININSMDEFLSGFWEKWFAPMDANVLLCMADKWKNGNVAMPYDNDLSKALGRITARTTVIAYSEDMFIPEQDCRSEQAMIADSKLEVMDSLWGHFTTMGLFEEDFKRLNDILGELLSPIA